MHRKRIIILLVVVAAVSLGLFMVISPVRSGLDYQAFQTEIARLELTQIATLERGISQEAQPFAIRLQAALAKLTGYSFAILGTPESATSMLLEQRDGEGMPILMRHSGKNINRITIYCDPNTKPKAQAFRDALTKTCPGLNVNLKLSQDASPQL